MSPGAWVTLVTIGLMLLLLAMERLSPALAVFGAVVFLLVIGVVEPSQALVGFSSSAPFTVAALYVVARAVEKTGALQPLLGTALGRAGSNRGALARLLPPVATASAFVNNTPIVAMVMPQVEAWARRSGRAAALFLMPLSFAAILGGVVTVIGTSSTIVVSALMEEHGLAPLGMFEISVLGLPLAVLGVGLVIALGPVLLRERAPAFEDEADRSRRFTVEMEVVPGGPLDGVTVGDGALRSLHGVFLTEVRRDVEVIAPAAPATLLRGGDRLVFVGLPDDVLDLRNRPGLTSAEEEHERDFHVAGHAYFEVVVGPQSPLVGRTLKAVGFRSRYQAAVVAIHRAGAPVRAQLRTVRRRSGDTLLLLSDEEFRDRWRDRSDFLLVSHFGGTPPVSLGRARTVGVVLPAMVIAAATGLLPLLHATLLGAFALIFLRVVSVSEARRAIDTDVVILIAAAFGLGEAVESTGLAAATVTAVIDPLATVLGSHGALLGLILVTVVLTEMVTNTAAAVLVFPIALGTAAGHGLDVRVTAMALAVAASASFLTPLGYQTNTMVYGPGGYRFTDYARLGFPLTVVIVVGLIVLVPLISG